MIAITSHFCYNIQPTFIGVAIGVGLVFASLVYSIARNPAQKNELLRYAFIGFSLVEASGMIGLVFGFVLLFGF